MMEAVSKIKRLMENANEIRRLFLQKIPKWKADKATWDKTRWGFTEGEGDGYYKGQSMTIHFGAWAGTYGDSSTYKQIDLDGAIFKSRLLKYLNDNQEKIMLAVADSMEKDAALLKESAETELKQQLSKLTELETPQQ
jgi:hypothetical protein